MPMKTEEWLKYVAERFAEYVETPRDVRRERRLQWKRSRAPWTIRWFGMLPLSFRLWLTGRKRNKNASE
jgi:hypothetical protein